MRCKCCKDKFEVKYFLQKYCMDKDECIKAFSESVKEKKQKTESKAWNKEKRQRIDKLKTLTDWKKDLEKLINAIVRLIDKGNPCMMCSGHPMKRINACHYHAVGGNDTIRFNLFNIWAGCHSCNSEKGGNIHGYDVLLIEKQGRERWEYVKFDLLRIYKYIGLSIPEIKEAIVIARKIKRELEKIDKVYSYEMRWKLRTKYNERLNIYKQNE